MRPQQHDDSIEEGVALFSIGLGLVNLITVGVSLGSREVRELEVVPKIWAVASDLLVVNVSIFLALVPVVVIFLGSVIVRHYMDDSDG